MIWKNLLDRYRSARAKRKPKSGAARGKILKPWKFESQMQFLNDSMIQPSNTKSNIGEDESNDTFIADEER